MPQGHRYVSAASIVCLFLLSSLAQAAEFCVTSSAELQAALDQADSNGQDDLIRITQGTYAVPQGSSFIYRGGATFNGDDNDLTILGGYIFFAEPCGARLNNDNALDTILTGEGRERVMRIYAGEQSNVTINGVSFFSGSPSGGDASRGGGLNLGTFGDTAGTFRVERSAFIANTAEFSSAVSLSDARTIRFANNLVVGNRTEFATGAVGIVQIDQNGVYVLNNTIINNLTDGGPGNLANTGLRIFVSDSSRALIANNILWGNQYNDIDYAGTGFTTSRNNSIGGAIRVPDIDQDNVSIAPVFQSGGFFNFNLVPDSPLVDAGLNPPRIPLPIFEANWSLPDTDLQGEPRLINATVDLGAFETAADGIFRDRFN